METGFLTKDLAIIMLAIGLATIVCNRLKLPTLLGFILAGVFIDPIFKLINDHLIIKELGNLGILFMMFFVGMEFNLGKLRKVMTPALCAIILQTLTMSAVGIIGAKIMGMSSIVGLFLGGMLSISSTIVFMEVMESRGDLKKKYALLATGILILEDLLAILMLVFLSGVAISKAVEWDKIWHVCFMLATFVVAIFAIGKVFLPPLLRKMSLSKSNHVVMIFALAMMFGLGEFAEILDFSVALGAFLAGSILAGMPIASQIEELITPFKNLFVALFFVSVGMMINPEQLLDLATPILILSVCVLLGQSLSCFFGAAIAGVEPHTAWLAGINKARIGEFSFVIATLGMDLQVIDSSIASIAMGVAFVTIFLNPLFVKQGVMFADFSQKHSPRFVKSAVCAYDNLLTMAKKDLNANKLLSMMRVEIAEAFIYFLLFNSVLLGATLLGGSNYVAKLTHAKIAISLIWFLAAVLILPFWIAIIRKISVLIETFVGMSLNGKVGRYKERFATVLRYAAALLISIFLLSIYLTAAGAQLTILETLAFMATFSIIVGAIFYRNFTHINTKLEYTFIENFNRNLENDSDFRREKLRNDILEKYPWPIELSEITIDRGSVAAGKTIGELSVRKSTGVNIVAIEREGYVRYDISPSTAFYPGDLVVVIGQVEQIKNAHDLLSRRVLTSGNESDAQSSFEISYLVASAESSIIGKSLRDLDMSRRYGVSVIGIQRGAQKITSPSADEKILPDDILLVMGKTDDVVRLSKKVEG